MHIAVAACLLLLARAAYPCGAPICIVDPQALALTRIITFDDTRSSMGPGHLIDDLLVMDGASFGEHFAGQALEPQGDHDQVAGFPMPPLRLLSGGPGRNLSVVHMTGNNVLNGYGMAGFPKRSAQGEGAIAVMFDEDQPALSFQLRGGEAGQAQVLFLRRDGSPIATMDLTPTGEHAIGFERAEQQADIAGFVLTNTDPQGLAFDNLRFGRPPDLS